MLSGCIDEEETGVEPHGYFENCPHDREVDKPFDGCVIEHYEYQDVVESCRIIELIDGACPPLDDDEVTATWPEVVCGPVEETPTKFGECCYISLEGFNPCL